MLETTENEKKSQAQSYWTLERVEKLRSLWGSGLSSQKIAESLGGGISRNAVIGKINRIKNFNRRKKPEISLEKSVNAGSVLFSFVDKGCQWPVSQEGDAFAMCGREKVQNKPYCSHHCALAYQSWSDELVSVRSANVNQKRKKRVS